MAYRNDLDALAARHALLDAEVAAKSRDRDEAARLLDDARDRAKRVVLANLRVAAPCTESWAGMTGDDRVRACGTCNQNVYNLSELTRDEAEALLHQHEGRLCVRYFQRHDGTILTKDCAVGTRRRRRRRIVAAGVAASLAGAAIAYEATRLRCEPTMGAVPARHDVGEWNQGGARGHRDEPPPKR